MNTVHNATGHGMMSDYDIDILQWSEHQGGLLRRRAAGQLVNDGELDWANIAEEIESVGRSERSALASRIRTIIEHLAKLDVSPATEPRAGWRDTVLRARTEIEALLEDSPSLRQRLDGVVKSERVRALRLAASALAQYGETMRVPLDSLQYSVEEVVGPWLPADRQDC
jgi:hypothetical protein